MSRITLGKAKLMEQSAEDKEGVVKIYNIWFFEGEEPEQDSVQYVTKESLVKMLAMFD